MAEALWLVRRTSQGESSDRNRVREVLINNDDGDSPAVIMLNTVAALNLVQPVEPGAEPIYPAGYFHEVIDITDLIGTGEENLRTPGDFIAFGGEIVSRKTPEI